jgi:hypothetical protein
MHAPASPPAPDPVATPRELIRALGVVYGATFLLLVGQLIFPPLGGYTQLGLAIVLLQTPWWVLPRGLSTDDARCTFTIGPIGGGLRLSFAVMGIVFPIFVGGFHLVYTTVLDRPADWDLARLSRWDEDLEYAPDHICGRAETLAWTQRDTVWIIAPQNQSISVRARAPTDPEARLVLCQGDNPVVRGVTAPNRDGLWRLRPGEGLQVALADHDHFDLQLLGARNEPLPAGTIRLGARGIGASDDGVLADSRDAWWLLAFILIQLGLVALPEEHFFRGYLQGRLDTRWGTPWRLFGTRVGWGLVASSLAFALMHPILIPGPHRLLVFFPSLLFGWLRARQQHLGAAIAVHAGSNLLLAIVGRMY